MDKGYLRPRGKKPLGNPHARNKAALSTLKTRADVRARRIAPIIAAIRAAGATTLKDIAAGLNNRGIKPARGGKWYAATVRNLLLRLEG